MASTVDCCRRIGSLSRVSDSALELYAPDTSLVDEQGTGETRTYVRSQSDESKCVNSRVMLFESLRKSSRFALQIVNARQPTPPRVRLAENKDDLRYLSSQRYSKEEGSPHEDPKFLQSSILLQRVLEVQGSRSLEKVHREGGCSISRSRISNSSSSRLLPELVE